MTTSPPALPYSRLCALYFLAFGVVSSAAACADDPATPERDGVEAHETAGPSETADSTDSIDSADSIDDVEAADAAAEAQPSDVHTTEPPDTTVSTDTVPVEVLDTRETNDSEEVASGCDADADCRTLAGGDACNAPRCIDGVCELAPVDDGAPCQDGDLCTTGDACRDGICETGAGLLACAPLGPDEPCAVATCVPATGCGKAPRPSGSPCDNGTGAEPGTCVAGGFLGADACDGQSRCRDATVPEVDPSAPVLAGAWFAVHTTFGGFAEPGTSRALFAVSAGGDSFVVQASESSTVSPFADGAEGFFCTRDDGSVEGRIGPGRMVGHQIDQRLAVAVDPVTDGIAVLLRADEGSSTQVSGRYAYFQTTIVFGSATPATWRGSVELDGGCLVSGAIATDPAVAGQYDFVTAPGGDCLTASTAPEERGLYRLLTSARAHVGDPQAYPIDLRGAIGLGGDVLLLVKEVHLATPSTKPEYGLVILVRDPVTGPLGDPAAIAGAWIYNQQVKLGGDLPRRDSGVIDWTAAGAIAAGSLATLNGPGTVSGGWFAIGSGKDTFAQHLSVGGLALYQSGVVAPSGRFAVGWNVRAPQPGAAGILEDTPRYGSMLLMLRPD